MVSIVMSPSHSSFPLPSTLLLPLPACSHGNTLSEKPRFDISTEYDRNALLRMLKYHYYSRVKYDDEYVVVARKNRRMSLQPFLSGEVLFIAPLVAQRRLRLQISKGFYHHPTQTTIAYWNRISATHEGDGLTQVVDSQVSSHQQPRRPYRRHTMRCGS